ncbi:hypothetical protein I4U23_000481 [Adineta vaga]|nr:hypothetical protein I4U23_000481 [Adineta vaga]
MSFLCFPAGTDRNLPEKNPKISARNSASMFQEFPVLSCRNRPVLILDGAAAAKPFEIVVNANLAVNGKDVFEIFNGSTACSIRISASTSVAVAWGFNYYLKYVADGSVYWSVPVRETIRIIANNLYRWYENPCTFSYSAVFWNFSQWQKEIDWMVMNGINIVYATTGMEYIYNKVFLRMGFPQSELDSYFTDPAFLA